MGLMWEGREREGGVVCFVVFCFCVYTVKTVEGTINFSQAHLLSRTATFFLFPRRRPEEVGEVAAVARGVTHYSLLVPNLKGSCDNVYEHKRTTQMGSICIGRSLWNDGNLYCTADRLDQNPHAIEWGRRGH